MKLNTQAGGTLELADVTFAAEFNQPLVHQVVTAFQAKGRQGTKAQKNRSAVRGGGAKPWKQKGTGRARQGTTRAPQWAGGGSAFGPVPRSYDHKLPKKVRRAALRCALSQRLEEAAITVVDSLEIGEYKTKRVAEILGALGIEGGGVLIVIDAEDAHIERSARNLPRVKVLRAAGLNVYDVLRYPSLVLTSAAVAAIDARLGGAPKEASA